MKVKLILVMMVGLLSAHVFGITVPLDGTWYTGSPDGTPSLSDPNAASFTWGTDGSATESAQKGALWSYFTEQSLAVDGDLITLSFTVVPADANATAQSFRFGLFNSGGTQVLTNLSGTNSDVGFLDTLGYYSQWNQGTSTTAYLYARTAGKTNPLSSTSDVDQITQVAESPTLQQGTEYDMTLTVTRYSAALYGVTSSINDANVISDTTTTINATSFDTVAFLNPPTGIDSMEFANLTVTTGTADFPLITGQPEDVSAFEGDPASLTVAVTNPLTGDATGLTYQWYRGLPGDTSSPVGTDSATYTIDPVAAADEGSYYCIVTLTATTETSESQAAELTVNRLIAHYEFDGDATDATGVYDGTEFGDPNYTTGSGGLFGEAIVLDGVDDRVEYTLAELTVMPQFTVTLWAQTSDPLQAGSTGLFNNGDGASTTNFQIDMTGSGDYRIQGTGLGFTTPADPNTWTLLAITYDGTTTRAYGNGELIGSVNYGNNRFDRFCVGVNRGTNNYFQGIIDDVRVYNYARTNVEMALAYTDVMGGEICAEPPVYDYDGDCEVTISDLAYFVNNGWLDCGLVPAEGCY